MSWLKNLWDKIVQSNDWKLEAKIKNLEGALLITKTSNDLYKAEVNNLKESVKLLKAQIEELESKLESKFLEYYWNNKVKPKKTMSYPARNGKMMNVLKYFHEKNDETPVLTDESDSDFIANNCLKWVKRNIKYVSDEREHWQWVNETVSRKQGDCEDGAILMANMMLKSGVPYWRVRLNAGDVKGGGHAYVTYLRVKDNKWYVLDWCYWYTESVNFKKLWVNAKKYFGIWFSWNEKYGFKKNIYDR